MPTTRTTSSSSSTPTSPRTRPAQRVDKAQEILDGRGLTLVDVMSHLHSPNLEVLDLWGKCSSATNQVLRMRTSKKERTAVKAKLAKLRALDGGTGAEITDSGGTGVGAVSSEGCSCRKNSNGPLPGPLRAMFLLGLLGLRRRGPRLERP